MTSGHIAPQGGPVIRLDGRLSWPQLTALLQRPASSDTWVLAGGTWVPRVDLRTGTAALKIRLGCMRIPCALICIVLKPKKPPLKMSFHALKTAIWMWTALRIGAICSSMAFSRSCSIARAPPTPP